MGILTPSIGAPEKIPRSLCKAFKRALMVGPKQILEALPEFKKKQKETLKNWNQQIIKHKSNTFFCQKTAESNTKLSKKQETETMETTPKSRFKHISKKTNAKQKMKNLESRPESKRKTNETTIRN